jgi:beta-lactamase superfamily II metal-dependent hydrolase
MLRVHAFPAQDGDSLLLSYGDEAQPRYVLVDGGRDSTYITLRAALDQIAKRGGRLDLLVLTHIDADHIAGILKLTGDRKQPIEVGEVWFNGFQKLVRLQAFSPGQGDRFSNAIQILRWCWNGAFDGACVALQADRVPLRLKLAGGLRVILLSPDQTKLQLLRKAWEAWRNRTPEDKQAAPAAPASAGLQEMGRRPMPSPLNVEALAFVPEEFDATVNNGSSIAFVAEWEGKRILMAGDAHTDLLVHGLRHLAAKEGGTCRLDLFKLSHHGSKGNTSGELLELIDCPRFLLSTDGSRHGHPDPQTIARILKFSKSNSKLKSLYFNYRQDYTSPWNQPSLREAYSYECRYPEGLPQGQIIVEV